jgi:hypothetical protein
MILAIPAYAHIGSPDTFVQAQIGSYTVLLAVHPPAITPGALELDLRFAPEDHITSITAALDDAAPTDVPLVLDGTATTSIWSPSDSSHTLHVTVQGGRGYGTYFIDLPGSLRSLPSRPKRFGFIETRNGLTIVLVVLLALVIVILFVIPEGNNLLHRNRKSIFVVATTLAMLLAVIFAHRRASATTLTASLNGSQLDFTLTNPSEIFADLLPDHGKLIHLFLVREPGKDVFLHLHPVQLSPGHFRTNLPAMPPGTYTLFADLYHSNGIPETVALRLTLPGQSHSALTDPDDTTAVLPPITNSQSSRSTNRSGENPVFGATVDQVASTTLHAFTLHDGYTLTLLAPAHLTPLHANLFTVTLLDPTGHPPQDMALYLSMSAHAVILRTDDQVFAHIHPGGTLPMLMPANMMMSMSAATNTATIPYGFPSTGLYRIFVQMKHGHIVETGAFDLDVD